MKILTILFPILLSVLFGAGVFSMFKNGKVKSNIPGFIIMLAMTAFCVIESIHLLNTL